MISGEEMNTSRFMFDPLYRTMVEILTRATIQAVDDADARFDELDGVTISQHTRIALRIAAVTKAILCIDTVHMGPH